MENLEELLTGQEYARLRRCSVRTIERERTTGVGCRYIKLGRSVRYMRRDVLDFIERNARHSTSEPAQMTAAEIAAALDSAGCKGRTWPVHRVRATR